MFTRTCSFDGCTKPLLAKGYCSAHYRQWRKGKPLRRLRPFYGKTGPYGPNGACRFNDLPQVRSGEWEPCLAARATGGWCAGHAAQWYEKRPLKPLRRRRTGCDFPDCPNSHSCRGYCAAHYQQLRQGKPLTPLNQRKGRYRASNGYIYGRYAAKRGERPCSLTVWGVCHVTPQCSSSPGRCGLVRGLVSLCVRGVERVDA
jgi:hypothetical protein